MHKVSARSPRFTKRSKSFHFGKVLSGPGCIPHLALHKRQNLIANGESVEGTISLHDQTWLSDGFD
jgi:hypothetical protein